MTARRILEIAAFCAALLVAALAVHAWLASRDDQRRLKSTLSTQKQIIDAATADQQTSALKLKDTLAEIDKLKSATQTPEQILRELPKYLPLPEPITMTRRTSASASATPGTSNNQQGIATSQFRTAPGAAESPKSASSESANPSNNKLADTLPSAASGAADRASDSRLKAFLDFFRDVRKAKPVPSSPPSPVCQTETSALIANPAVNATSLEPVDGSSNPEHIPDSAAPAGNLGTRKTNPAAIPCIPEGTDDGKAPHSAFGVGTPGPKLPADTPVPQETSVPDTSAEIPAHDLKPLFDFVQDCRSCDAQLKAATQTQADNSAKILALTKERDAAITAARGGKFLRRLRRNALWFAVGAGVGLTTYAARH